MKKVGLCILAAVAFTPPAFAAQCLELRFLDEQGVLMPVNPPLIGIMVGDEAPLFEGVPPAYAKIEAGRMVPCPEALLASSRKAFEDFCTSDERRKKAAAANNVDMSIVNKRCTDLNLALTP